MKRKNTNEYYNQFTGERLSVYPTIFARYKKKRKVDQDKLNSQQDNFSKKYVCPICGQPKTWVQDTNLMVCQNESCPGIPVKNKDGEIVNTLPSYSQLNTRGAEIAATLFQ